MGNSGGHHRRNSKEQREKRNDKKEAQKEKKQKRKNSDKRSRDQPDVDESSHLTGGDSESCLFHSAENVAADLDSSSNRRPYELSSDWVETSSTLSLSPRILSSQDFQDGFSLEACIPPEIARPHAHTSLLPKDVNRDSPLESASASSPSCSKCEETIRTKPDTETTNDLTRTPSKRSQIQASQAPLSNLERDNIESQPSGVFSASPTSGHHHPHFYNHHNDRSQRRTDQHSPHQSTSPTASPSSKPTSPTTPVPQRRAANFLHLFKSSDKSEENARTPEVNKDTKIQTSKNETKVKPKFSWKTWERTPSAKAEKNMTRISIFGTSRKSNRQADDNVASVFDEMKRETEAACLENLTCSSNYSLSHKFDDSSSHKLGDSSSHKLGDSLSHKLGDSSSHRFGNSSSHKLSDSSSHRFGNSSSHKLGDSSSHKLGDSSSHKLGDSSSQKLGDTSCTTTLTNQQIELDDSPQKQSSDETTNQQGTSTESRTKSGEESPLLSHTAAICIRKLEELERSIERTIRDKFPDMEAFLLKKRSNEELVGSRSLPTTPSLKKKLYIVRDVEEDERGFRDRGVTRFCDETYETPPSPARSPVIVRRFGARTRHASISPKLARAKTAVLFNSPSEMINLGPSLDAKVGSQRPTCHDLPEHNRFNLFNVAQKSASKYDNVIDESTADACCTLHQACNTQNDVQRGESPSGSEISTVIKPTLSAMFGSVSPKLRKHYKDSTVLHKDSPVHHKDSTVHHKDSPVYHKDSTAHHKHSTVLHKDSIVHHKDSTVHHKDFTVHRKDSSALHKDSTINNKSVADEKTITNTGFTTQVAAVPHREQDSKKDQDLTTPILQDSTVSDDGSNALTNYQKGETQTHTTAKPGTSKNVQERSIVETSSPDSDVFKTKLNQDKVKQQVSEIDKVTVLKQPISQVISQMIIQSQGKPHRKAPRSIQQGNQPHQQGLQQGYISEPREKTISCTNPLSPEKSAKLVLPEKTTQLVSLEKSAQLVLPKKAIQLVSPETSTQIVSQEKASQLVLPEKSTLFVSPEKFTQLVSPEKATQLVSPEKSTQLVSPEKATQLVSPEKSTQLVSPEIATQLVSPERSTQLVFPEKATQVVSQEKSTQLASTEKATQPVSPKKLAQLAHNNVSTPPNPQRPFLENKVLVATSHLSVGGCHDDNIHKCIPLNKLKSEPVDSVNVEVLETDSQREEQFVSAGCKEESEEEFKLPVYKKEPKEELKLDGGKEEHREQEKTVPPPSPTIIHQIMEELLEDDENDDDEQAAAMSRNEQEMNLFTDIIYKRLSDLLESRSGQDKTESVDELTHDDGSETEIYTDFPPGAHDDDFARSDIAEFHIENGSSKIDPVRTNNEDGSKMAFSDDSSNDLTSARNMITSLCKRLTIESSSSLTTTTSSESDIDEPALVLGRLHDNRRNVEGDEDADCHQTGLDDKVLEDANSRPRDMENRRGSREYHSDDDVTSGRGIPDYYDDRPLWSRRQKAPGQLSAKMRAVQWRERRERWLKKRRRNRTDLLSTGSSDTGSENCTTGSYSLVQEHSNISLTQSRTTDDMPSGRLTSPKYTKPILPFLDNRSIGSEQQQKSTSHHHEKRQRVAIHTRSYNLEEDRQHSVQCDQDNDQRFGSDQRASGADVADVGTEDTSEELASVETILMNMQGRNQTLDDRPCLALTTENVRSIREYYRESNVSGSGRRSRLSATDRTESDLDLYSERPDDASSGSDLYADDEGDDEGHEPYTTADDDVQATPRADHQRSDNYSTNKKNGQSAKVLISYTFYNSSSQPESRCEQNEVVDESEAPTTSMPTARVPSCYDVANSDEEFWSGSAAAMEDSYKQLETAADAISSTFQNARVQMHDIQHHLQALRRQMEIMQDDLTNI